MKRAAIGVFAAFSVFVAFTLSARAAPKPSNEDCLACHGDSTLSKGANGKPVSLYVSPEKFKASIHRGMFACVDRHSDIKSSMHEATPAKVKCSQCHADEQAVYDPDAAGQELKAATLHNQSWALTTL